MARQSSVSSTQLIYARTHPATHRFDKVGLDRWPTHSWDFLDRVRHDLCCNRISGKCRVSRSTNKVEQRAREHPDQPSAAWDLARVKLESYLNRNLRQVHWIFILTLLVMTAGFVIIGYGVYHVYQSPESFNPSIVVTVSGILVEFIAATFLLIYRSTMDQARSYVSMLEKINAVGMSIQILDTMKSGDTDKFRAQLAMELLSLYGVQNRPKPSKSNSTS